MTTTDSTAARISCPSIDQETGEPVARVLLKPRKTRPFFGRHPWVLDSAIASVEGTPADGEVVDLVSDKGKFIARGVFNSASRIRVRLYSWEPGVLLDDAFWRARLARAIELRRRIGYDAPQGSARLVFSEADGLSGLIVDRYANYLAVQVNARAMAARLPRLAHLLGELLHPRGIVVRGERGVSQLEAIQVVDGTCWGEPPAGPVFVEENGLRFGVDLSVGQKTGFYLDQRENRLAAARYAAGLSVLDMCCYSGAFSLAAARAGAREVLGVDASDKAVALARANAALNGIANVHFAVENCFASLASAVDARQRFGMVILDPPKFARSRKSLNEALAAYHRLNRLGVDLLEPGGILVTCSCSGHVTREDFLHTLAGVAQQTRREIQVLEQRGAAPDHPVAATCLETEYLKCFICRCL